LLKLYKVHEQRCMIHYDELSMTVTAYGLSNRLLPDITITRLTFHTTTGKHDKPVGCASRVGRDLEIANRSHHTAEERPHKRRVAMMDGSR
jgi:hypothetical protein